MDYEHFALKYNFHPILMKFLIIVVHWFGIRVLVYHFINIVDTKRFLSLTSISY